MIWCILAISLGRFCALFLIGQSRVGHSTSRMFCRRLTGITVIADGCALNGVTLCQHRLLGMSTHRVTASNSVVVEQCRGFQDRARRPKRSKGKPPAPEPVPSRIAKRRPSVSSPSRVPPSPDYFPYGSANFREVRRDNLFWCDNSNYIFDLVESSAQHQLFLRPPRWGKSLLMDMLHCYLDVNQADRFDELFGGTNIHKRKANLKHRNRYHVVKFDFSVDVTNTDVMAIKKEFDQEIENAIEDFCLYYDVSYGSMTTPLSKLERVVKNVAIIKGADVFVLVDEYDRFANELMFNSPDEYDKVVAGVSGEKLCSPVRSFFSMIKSLNTVRSFTVGLSPIALADASGANNIDFITQDPRFANMLGFSEQDVKRAVELLFDKKDVPKAVEVAKQFFNGYRFPYHRRHPVGEPLFTPQLCLHFFQQCCEPEFRQDVIVGNVTTLDMSDPGVKVPSNIVPLLSRHSESPVIFASLSTPEGVRNAAVLEDFKLDALKTASGPDLPVSLMVWHGLLTRGEHNEFKVANKIMGDPDNLLAGLLSEIHNGADCANVDALSVVQNPTEAGLWNLLTASLKDIGSTFDYTVSELAIQALVVQFVRRECPSVNIEVEKPLPNSRRFNMCLTARTSDQSVLLIEFKRLRPHGGKFPADISRKSLQACTHSEARTLLEHEAIHPDKLALHTHKVGGVKRTPKTVGELEKFAMEQCELYKVRYGAKRQTENSVCHSDSRHGSGTIWVFGTILKLFPGFC